MIARKYDGFCQRMADVAGNATSFLIALFSMFIWAGIGPYYNYSEGWLLWANTIWSIITFLMMFLLQNTGNRTIAELSDQLSILAANHKEIEDDLQALKEQNEKIISLLEKR